MTNYDVYATDSFKKLYLTLDRSEQNWIDKIKIKLGENPTGKILHFNWFREKKYEGKRLYFLVDDDRRKLLFVSFATKKDQQKVIDFVISHKDEFLKTLREL